MLHPYVFSSTCNGVSLKDEGCNMYLIPTTLVHTLFSTPISTSTFNFMQYLLLSFFVVLGPKLVFSWAIVPMMQFAPQVMTRYFVADWLTAQAVLSNVYTSMCHCMIVLCVRIVTMIRSYRHDT